MPVNQNIIVKCEIRPYSRPFPLGVTDPLSMVKIQLNTGEQMILFDFYPDELSFSESDFIGLTIDLARRLKFEKEIYNLRSQKVISRY